jgi:outer membrane protein assembly factor BamB
MNLSMKYVTTLIGVFALGAALSNANDWPEYRGPNGDGVCRETPKLTWPASGPKVLWRIPVKNGFSSFTIADGKAFTVVIRDVEGAPREVCVALEAGTGKELWFAPTGVAIYDGGGDSGAADNKGGDGPRSTPTVSDGKVYVLNQLLVLSCLDEQTGKALWMVDLIKDHAGRNIGWKSAASPVIDGNLVFLGGGGPGESLLALNKDTGAVVWKSQDEIITHATPVVRTILGVPQVIFFMKSGLVSVSEKDGSLLWRFPFRFSTSTAASPVVAGDIVYCSAAYGVGGGACRISKDGNGFTATELYKVSDNKLANHWSTPVVKDGFLYGVYSHKQYGTAPLKCVEMATGEIKWSQPGFGQGNVILIGDKVLALTDDGQLVVVKAAPQSYEEVSRAKVLTGKCWSTPALSNGRLYVRSTKEAACVDVSGS